MDPRLLLKEFDRLLDTPDSITKLRELILQLAVRGKLVPHDPGDEPAEVLLMKIEEEKERLYRKGEIRKPRKRAPIKEADFDFPVPEGWLAVRLGDVVILNPRNDLEPKIAVSFIPMSLIEDGFRGGHAADIRLWKEVRSGYTHFAENDIGIAKITPCFQNRKSTIFRHLENGFGAGTTELHVLRPLVGTILPDYLLAFAKTPRFIEDGVRSMTGTAGQQRVSRKCVEESFFPLPPLAEQRRIVAKVDELMRLCDELESRQRGKRETRVRLGSAALETLQSAAPEAFGTRWSFVRRNFDLMMGDVRNVRTLRETILQLAVRGKLVPQDPEDEPMEMRELASTQPNRHPLLSYDHQVPPSWSWASLGALVSKMGSGSTPKGGRKVYTDDGVPFIRSQNVWNDGLRLANVALIPDSIHQQRLGTAVLPGDILLNITGASIGRSCIVPHDFECGNVSQHVAIIRPHDSRITAFLHLYLISPLVQRQIMDVQVGISREGLSMRRLKGFEVPLPPLPEQQEIISKVDELMRVCNLMEQRIEEAAEDGVRLMEAVVAEAVNGRSDTESLAQALHQ